jgi:membrane protein
MQIKAIPKLLQDTLDQFIRDNVLRLAAALSYYTVFSLPPLLVIVLAIVGSVFGREAAQGKIRHEMQGLVGDQAATAVQALIENAAARSNHGLAALAGVLILIFGATGVFTQIQAALNTIWGVKPAPRRRGRVWSFLAKRLLSFGMVVGIGFMLLVSLVVSAALSAFGAYLDLHLQRWFVSSVLEVLNFVLSFGVTTCLIAAMYTVLPDAKIPFREVWFGAVITSLLFAVGKTVIGVYLGRTDPGSAYGAAGSLAIVLVWIYYSSIVLFLGAEFTQVFARWRGWRFAPEEHAVSAHQTGKPVTEAQAGTHRDERAAAPGS